MTKLFTFPERWRKGRNTTFSKNELSQLMALYGERVSKGEWRDYALDCSTNVAIFSIYKHSHEQPLFSISKVNDQNNHKSSKYIINDGRKTLKQCSSLVEALQFFEELKA